MRHTVFALAALVLAATGGASAETVYKCVAGGQTIYQQTPCAKSQRQETIQLQDSAPANGQVAPMPGSTMENLSEQIVAELISQLNRTI